MSKYMDRAKELRACQSPHYNCAQSVLLPFAPDAGMSEEDAFRLAANFGGGMQMGGACGAFTGGMMALGLWGVDEKTTVNAETGLPRKPHCDGMVYEAVALVEEILRSEGKID